MLAGPELFRTCWHEDEQWAAGICGECIPCGILRFGKFVAVGKAVVEVARLADLGTVTILRIPVANSGAHLPRTHVIA